MEQRRLATSSSTVDLRQLEEKTMQNAVQKAVQNVVKKLRVKEQRKQQVLFDGQSELRKAMQEFKNSCLISPKVASSLQ